METFKDKLKKIQELYDSKLITSEEYYKLRGEILDEDEPYKEKQNKTQKILNCSVQRLKNAGGNVKNIFYGIIFQAVLIFLYWICIVFRIGYDEATNTNSEIFNFTNYLNKLNIIFYVSQAVISLVFMSNLWKLGENLLNIDKQTEKRYFGFLMDNN